MLKFFTYLTLLMTNMPILASDNCHPLPHIWKNQYIVGYGSLLDETSKRMTSKQLGKNTPFFLNHYARTWHTFKDNKTYLGIVPKKEHQTSAVYFKLPFHQIKRFDKREKGYCRQELRSRPLLPTALPYGQYWIYIPTSTSKSKSLHIPVYYKKMFLIACQKLAISHHLPRFYQSCLDDMPKKTP